MRKAGALVRTACAEVGKGRCQDHRGEYRKSGGKVERQVPSRGGHVPRR